MVWFYTLLFLVFTTNNTFSMRVSKKKDGHTLNSSLQSQLYRTPNTRGEVFEGNLLHRRAESRSLDVSRSVLTISSPNRPGPYPYHDAEWLAKPNNDRESIRFSCDDFRLHREEYLVLTLVGDRVLTFTSASPPPDVVSCFDLIIELRSYQPDPGLLHCQIESTVHNTTCTDAVHNNTTGQPITTITENPSTAESQTTTLPTTTTTLSPTENCGLMNYQVKIVGGEDAQRNRFPYMCSLTERGSYTPFCGCVVISEYHVLTAAHCVYNLGNVRIEVVLNKTSYVEDPGEIHMEVDKITIHSEYSSYSLDNDIAMINLTASMAPYMDPDDLSAWPVCLPQQPCDPVTGEGCFMLANVTVAGFGTVSESGPVPSVLQHVTVPVEPLCRCKYKYQKRDYNITDRMICAGQSYGGQDSCQGDSGGPLTWEHDSKAVLVGLVSFGIGCARWQYPGVYTFVPAYLSWIEEHMVM